MKRERMTVKEVLEAGGIKDAWHGWKCEPETHYFFFDQGGKQIHVQSTATQFMNGVTRMESCHQALFFRTILSNLMHPGAKMTIDDDVFGGKHAIVSRLANAGDAINLLVSR